MKRCSPDDTSPPQSPIFKSKRREDRRKGTELDSPREVSLLSVSGESEKECEKQSEEPKLLGLQTSTPHHDQQSGGVRLTRLSSLSGDRVLSLGCPLLSSALQGGLRAGELTELVGESSAGKTQFSLQAALEAALRGETVLYIVTEGAFPSARLDQMVTAREAEEARDRILVKQARSLSHLLAVLGEEVREVVGEHPGTSLVIVDSVASLVRSEGELRTGLERVSVIHKLGQTLLQLTTVLGVAVVAVNQVTARLGGERDVWGRDQVASLGHSWAQYPNTRLWLTKTSYVIKRTACQELQGLTAETRLRTMNVDWSCRLANSETYFYVDSSGCHGIKIED